MGVATGAAGVLSRGDRGFRAIGTIVAIYCVLVFTYKKWQAADPAVREMRPNPFAWRADKRPDGARCKLL